MKKSQLDLLVEIRTACVLWPEKLAPSQKMDCNRNVTEYLAKYGDPAEGPILGAVTAAHAQMEYDTAFPTDTIGARSAVDDLFRKLEPAIRNRYKEL